MLQACRQRVDGLTDGLTRCGVLGGLGLFVALKPVRLWNTRDKPKTSILYLSSSLCRGKSSFF